MNRDIFSARRRRSFYGAVLFLALVSSTSGAEEGKFVTIAGHVSGASGTHAIGVALWRSDRFLETPFRTHLIPPHGAADFSFTVPAGEWAVSAFEDVNENGKLDMGFFGPKEPNGFWREFTGHRKPTFKDVSVPVSRDTSGVEIRLR